MPKTKIRFSGRNGVIALGIVVAFVVIRFLSLTPSNDMELRTKILVDLQSDIGNEVGKLIQKNTKKNDYSELAGSVSELTTEDPTIHRIWVSKSLFGLSSSAKAIVKVDFSMPNSDKRRIRYYRAKDSMVGGWTIGRETTVIAYYLNFL